VLVKVAASDADRLHDDKQALIVVIKGGGLGKTKGTKLVKKDRPGKGLQYWTDSWR
jgi:hypothetical protein